MNAQDFWDDAAAANKVMAELRYCKSCVEPYEKSVKKLAELKELSESELWRAGRAVRQLRPEQND